MLQDGIMCVYKLSILAILLNILSVTSNDFMFKYNTSLNYKYFYVTNFFAVYVTYIIKSFKN